MTTTNNIIIFLVFERWRRDEWIFSRWWGVYTSNFAWRCTWGREELIAGRTSCSVCRPGNPENGTRLIQRKGIIYPGLIRSNYKYGVWSSNDAYLIPQSPRQMRKLSPILFATAVFLASAIADIQFDIPEPNYGNTYYHPWSNKALDANNFFDRCFILGSWIQDWWRCCAHKVRLGIPSIVHGW